METAISVRTPDAAPAIAGPPMITGFLPTVGEVRNIIDISGQNLVGGAPVNNVQVAFGNGLSKNLPLVSDILIRAEVPLTATTGPITVRRNGESSSSVNQFVVKPTIDTFMPDKGMPEVTTVTITGRGFLNPPLQVFFTSRGGTVEAPITGSTATSVSVTLPRGAIDGPITVHTAGTADRPSQATSAQSFNVLPPKPRIRNRDGFSPMSGPVGTKVTLIAASGSTFQVIGDKIIVSFNGDGRRVKDPTAEIIDRGAAIRATVPMGARTGPIRVKNEGGKDDTSMDFVVLGDPTSPLPGTEEED